MASGPKVRELLLQGQNQAVWEKCCGFYDLSLRDFMEIQKQILLEQMTVLPKCTLGRKLLCGETPKTVDEFRRVVPLSSYKDYVPFLPEQNEGSLPEKPVAWQRTSGRSDEFPGKWVPVSQRMYDALGDVMLGVFIVGACRSKGDINLKVGDKMLYGLAPPPYASGMWMRRLDEEGILNFMPSVAEAEKMEFQERIEAGFKLALVNGLDTMGAIASVLVAIGNRFSEGGAAGRVGPLMKHPGRLAHLAAAFAKAKIQGRPLMPKDIWKLKGFLCSGTDAFVYREKLKEMWGKYPLDVYGATECQVIAAQAWDYGDMTFVPFINFWEFMPQDEYTKWQRDKTYQARTLLLDEVVPGAKYAVVGTNCLGGAYTRYVVGDLIEITSLRNEAAGINLPQMAFYGRADGILDFETAGHVGFTEKLCWLGIANSGAPYVDWIARKELEGGVPVLHLYLELKPDSKETEKELDAGIDKQFKSLSRDYNQITTSYGVNLLRVSTVPTGAFTNYMAARRAAGADLAHIKPPHMNPSDGIMKMLLGDEFHSSGTVAEIREAEIKNRVKQP
jgi:hypothetical protein